MTEQLPQHVQEFLQKDLRTRRAKGFTTPQHRAATRDAAQQQQDFIGVLLAVCIWALLGATAAFLFWFGLMEALGWIIERSQRDAALAPQIMLF